MSRIILTRLHIKRFKLFDDVDIELGERVVLIGPNNNGKTSVLQAIALWDLGVKRWLEKRGSGSKVPKKRPGVTINRRDLIALPVPSSKLLWRDLLVMEGVRDGDKTRTRNVKIIIILEGIYNGEKWECGLEFYYANEESFYCRPVELEGGDRMEVPSHLAQLSLSFLPPMSGLTANETRLDEGAINVRIGEGRTSEVLRNICFRVSENNRDEWEKLSKKISSLFGCKVDRPEYISERGEIKMTYTTSNGVRLDLSSAGSGMQQTLLLLSYMAAHPGSILLLDEPDAHLEILRQRQIYQVITDIAKETGGQLLVASHSEVILNEAADRDMVIAIVGPSPHRIDDRGSQLRKALKEIGFEQFYQAEERGWVLYLEGATDLAILRAFAKRLEHPAEASLERPFVHYVGNKPQKAREHFYGLREAIRDLRGIAVYDRLEYDIHEDNDILHYCWKKREIENYLCQKQTLISYATSLAQDMVGSLFIKSYEKAMENAIDTIESALKNLSKSSPWDPEIKASDEFLTPVFDKFFDDIHLDNLLRKTSFHVLVNHISEEDIDEEIIRVLDLIYELDKNTKNRMI